MYLRLTGDNGIRDYTRGLIPRAVYLLVCLSIRFPLCDTLGKLELTGLRTLYGGTVPDDWYTFGK